MKYKFLAEIIIATIIIAIVALIVFGFVNSTVRAEANVSFEDNMTRIQPIQSYMVMGGYSPVMIYEVRIGGVNYLITQGNYATGIVRKSK